MILNGFCKKIQKSYEIETIYYKFFNNKPVPPPSGMTIGVQKV